MTLNIYGIICFTFEVSDLNILLLLLFQANFPIDIVLLKSQIR